MKASPLVIAAKRRVEEHWTRHLKAVRDFPELNHKLFEPEFHDLPTDGRAVKKWKVDIEREMQRTA